MATTDRRKGPRHIALTQYSGRHQMFVYPIRARAHCTLTRNSKNPTELTPADTTRLRKVGKTTEPEPSDKASCYIGSIQLTQTEQDWFRRIPIQPYCQLRPLLTGKSVQKALFEQNH